jgi:hypothetical protein
MAGLGRLIANSWFRSQPTPVVQWLSALQREQSTTSAAQLTALGQELLTFKGEKQSFNV